MAEDDGFSAESTEREAGIFEGLAFFDAGGEAGDQRGVGTEAFGGEFEAGAGARGGLVEQERDAALEQDAVAHEGVVIFKLRARGREGG